jgi:hypothetical protein
MLQKNQSSNQKSSFTVLANTPESFKASSVEGMYLPVSNDMMVCLLTLTNSANSAWDKANSARSCLILFFISQQASKVNMVK